MTQKTSVYLEGDTRDFLKEEAFFTGKKQTVILNRAIRLFSLASHPDRLRRELGGDCADQLAKALESDILDVPIPPRATRR